MRIFPRIVPVKYYIKTAESEGVSVSDEITPAFYKLLHPEAVRKRACQGGLPFSEDSVIVKSHRRRGKLLGMTAFGGVIGQRFLRKLPSGYCAMMGCLPPAAGAALWIFGPGVVSPPFWCLNDEPHHTTLVKDSPDGQYL